MNIYPQLIDDQIKVQKKDLLKVTLWNWASNLVSPDTKSIFLKLTSFILESLYCVHYFHTHGGYTSPVQNTGYIVLLVKMHHSVLALLNNQMYSIRISFALWSSDGNLQYFSLSNAYFSSSSLLCVVIKLFIFISKILLNSIPKILTRW